MFILIDKPKGMTSHDVVSRLRQITGERRIGHGGTLDPNATGLLFVGIGWESTKKLAAIAKEREKTYIAEIVLGEERETDDSEGRIIVKAKGILPPSQKEIIETLQNFLGELEQIPPKYSAVKIEGKKAYELATEGKELVLKPRKITVYQIKLLSYEYPNLKIEVGVSSGTYIRALARDVGRKLGVGAYLSELQRTGIGEYSLERAVELGKINKRNWKTFAFEIDT